MIKAGPFRYEGSEWIDNHYHSLCEKSVEQIFGSLNRMKLYELRIYFKRPRTDVLEGVLIVDSQYYLTMDYIDEPIDIPIWLESQLSKEKLNAKHKIFFRMCEVGDCELEIDLVDVESWSPVILDVYLVNGMHGCIEIDLDDYDIEWSNSR